MVKHATTKMAIITMSVYLLCAGCGRVHPYFVSNYMGDGSNKAEQMRLAQYYSQENNPLGLHYTCYYTTGSGPPFQADIVNRAGSTVAINRGDLYAHPITPMPPGFHFNNDTGHVKADHSVAPGRYTIIVRVLQVGSNRELKKFGPREPLILNFEIPKYRIMRSGCFP